MIQKRILLPERLRQVPHSFSWIDHRLLRHGYLQHLLPSAMLLYFFLVLVGDQHGVSYYSLPSISTLLKLSPAQLTEARTTLCRHGLIAYEPPLYQVLSLSPPKPSPRGSISSMKEILKEMP